MQHKEEYDELIKEINSFKKEIKTQKELLKNIDDAIEREMMVSKLIDEPVDYWSLLRGKRQNTCSFIKIMENDLKKYELKLKNWVEYNKRMGYNKGIQKPFT